MLQLQNASVSYAGTPALKNISIQINDGEKIAIIGPSGAGKTTLLRTLYELKQQQSAFVHQSYALVPQLSVFHNVFIGQLDRHSVAYNLVNLVKPLKKEVAVILPVLEKLGLAELMSKRVGELSGGQQQRTAIARALYRNAEILFADEPVSSIDPHQADSVMSFIGKTAKTLILSMHDVALAVKFADRIVGLSLGSILFDLPSSRIDERLLTRLYSSC